ncbi:MAG: hypothetical protein HY278_09835 [candidate division NC10 bacterium]|nr:hypothetical protein [candidate division NC10 bacterium]
MEMKRVMIVLGLGLAVAMPVAAEETHDMRSNVITVAAAAPTTAPAHGVREELGPAFQFLLTTPPPNGGKVSPGEAKILRALCGTCSLNTANPWSTVVVVKSGTPVTLANLWRMHRNGAGWGEITQRELGVKLGTLVRESSEGKSGGFTQTGIVTGSGRPVSALGAPGQGHIGSGDATMGIVPGSGRTGALPGSASAVHGRGR